jgi:hypothetical protein
VTSTERSRSRTRKCEGVEGLGRWEGTGRADDGGHNPGTGGGGVAAPCHQGRWRRRRGRSRDGGGRFGPPGRLADTNLWDGKGGGQTGGRAQTDNTTLEGRGRNYAVTGDVVGGSNPGQRSSGISYETGDPPGGPNHWASGAGQAVDFVWGTRVSNERGQMSRWEATAPTTMAANVTQGVWLRPTAADLTLGLGDGLAVTQPFPITPYPDNPPEQIEEHVPVV